MSPAIHVSSEPLPQLSLDALQELLVRRWFRILQDDADRAERIAADMRRHLAQRMELGEPDDSGRRRPVPIEGSEFEMDCDLCIVAVGSGANPLLTSETPDMELNKWGYVHTEEKSGKTTKKGVWAGGDIVTGAATGIGEAIGVVTHVRNGEVLLGGFVETEQLRSDIAAAASSVDGVLKVHDRIAVQP